MPSPNDISLLEAYLDGSLDARSQSVLKRRLAAEPELRRALQAEQDLRAHLGTTDPRADLLAKLNAIMHEPEAEPPSTAWYTRPRVWLLLVALAGAIGWYLLRSPVSVTPLPAPTEVQPVIEAPDEEQAPPPVPVDSTTQQTNTEPSDVIPPSIRPPVPDDPAPDPTLAAAYVPNEQLEARMATRYRGGEIDVFPADAADLPFTIENEVVRFRMRGQIKTAIPIDELDLALHLYDNRPEGYANGAPLLVRPLPVTPTAERNTLAYDLTLYVELGAGLYYTVLHDSDTEEVLGVHRLRIE